MILSQRLCMKRKPCFSILLLIIMLVIIGCAPKTEYVSLPFVRSSRDAKVDMKIEVDHVEASLYEIKFVLPTVLKSETAKIFIGNKETKIVPTTKDNAIRIEIDGTESIQITIKYSAVYDSVFYNLNNNIK